MFWRHALSPSSGSILMQLITQEESSTFIHHESFRSCAVCTVITAILIVYVNNSNGLSGRCKRHFFCISFVRLIGAAVHVSGYFYLATYFCCSLFGAMFPLPRIIYAMAMDGLIFRFLGQVHHYFKTPFYGTLIAGLLTGLS